ncbi:MAG TPA: hypothetical protein VH639_05560 [Bryobacteraceae bacterium]
MDRVLDRAIRWSDDEADLMAIVLRSQIDLRGWAEFVAKGPQEAGRFLGEVNIDIRELHQKLDKALPDALDPLPAGITGTRFNLRRADDREEYYFKLCSKLIHPSALTILHPEAIIQFKEELAIGVLFYAWYILTRFHDVETPE